MASRHGYKVVFAADAVEFFVGLSKRRQRRLLDRAQELAADPFLAPDFHTVDASERKILHLMADGFIFDFWVDHAVKQVVVTDVENID